ncbi:MAG TPA: dephospho-CoA kinase [Puia sp.]|nr:dephospho-CoA kinase [Puia sp.]
MLRVGLTGGIGSGKSTIAAVFETLGVPVAYADQEAKRLMNEDAGLRDAIIRQFGADAYSGATLNRKYLAERVFGDPIALEQLNSLVHPVTIRDGEKWMLSLADHHAYAIREAALIFETRAAGHLDFIIGVYAPASLRIHRAIQRDHTTREDILRRMRNQIDEDIKMRLCDAVIRNDEQAAVIPQVLALHRHLISISPTHP